MLQAGREQAPELINICLRYGGSCKGTQPMQQCNHELKAQGAVMPLGRVQVVLRRRQRQKPLPPLHWGDIAAAAHLYPWRGLCGSSTRVEMLH